MIIEVDIVTLEVRVNGRVTGTTNIEKMHKCRDYARSKCEPNGSSTYYTILDGKIASQHDIKDNIAITIIYALLETSLMRMTKEGLKRMTKEGLKRMTKEGDPIANFLLRG